MRDSRIQRLLLPALVPLVGLGCASQLSPALVEIARHPTGRGPAAVVVADLDGDGRLDAAVANEASGDVSVFLGQPAGLFAEAAGSPFAAGPNPNNLAVADFDGDGAADFAVANHDSDRVTVLLARAGRWVLATAGPLIVGVRPHPPTASLPAISTATAGPISRSTVGRTTRSICSGATAPAASAPARLCGSAIIPTTRSAWPTSTPAGRRTC